MDPYNKDIKTAAKIENKTQQKERESTSHGLVQVLWMGIKYITQYLYSRREKNHINNMAFVANEKAEQGHKMLTHLCVFTSRCVGWLGLGIQGRAEWHPWLGWISQVMSGHKGRTANHTVNKSFTFHSCFPRTFQPIWRAG